MKITDVKTWVVGNPPPGIGGKYFIFVKLTTDCNVVGYGEAYNATFSGPCHRAHDRGHGRALPRRPRSARHRDLLPPLLFVRLHPAPRRFRHGLLLGARNGLLGHHRQGGRQAGLQAARRPGARDAALLHLPLSAHRQRPHRGCQRQERLQRSRHGRRMRRALCRAGLQRREARSRRPLHRLRRPPAAPDRHRPVGAHGEGDPRGGRHEGRHPVRHAWPVHRVGRAAHGARHRALRSAVVRGAGAAGHARSDGARSRAAPRSRSPPASG